MSEELFQSLAWLSYRLAATFAFGVPLIIFAWSVAKKESPIQRFISIYFKVASLLAISILLLISGDSLGYLTSLISSLLIMITLWFWIDLNEELKEMSINNGIALTTKIWRWCLTFWGLLFSSLHLLSFDCLHSENSKYCYYWTELPNQLDKIPQVLIKFLLGGNWNSALAGFVGYFTLMIYIIGFLQWLFLKLPKQGRIAGDF